MDDLIDRGECKCVEWPLVALGISLAIVGFGQAEKQYSANGTVRNARTGEPVQDVRMSIAMMPTAAQVSDPFSGEPWDPHAEEVLSGSAGEFRFEATPGGALCLRGSETRICAPPRNL